MKKVIQLTLILTILSGFLGCFRAKSFEERVNRVTEKLKKELSLTEEQAKKLESIRIEIINKQKNIKSNLNKEKIRTEVLNMIKSDKIDKDKFKKTTEPLVESRKEMMDFIITKLIEFHGVLNPDQKIKLANLMEEFHKKMEKHVGD